MVIIAVDTSHTSGSAALARDGRFVAGGRFGEGSSHLVGLGATVDRLLADQNLAPQDIERVALVAGPGSFTGLRIALAWVKGLHAAIGMDVVAMGTLELLALPYLDRWDFVCTMIDARRQEIYGALYHPDPSGVRARESVAPAASAPDSFLDGLPETPALFVGTGVARYRSLVETQRFAGARLITNEPDLFPSTQHLCAIAPSLDPLSHDQIRSLEPMYLRESGAKRSKLGPINP